LLVDEARERGVPGLGLRVGGPCESRALALFKQLSKMFRRLVAKRRLRASPVVGVEPPRASRARDRVLTEAEVRAFWRAASAERREFAAAHNDRPAAIRGRRDAAERAERGLRGLDDTG
jgi:hypothetical protein